MIFIYSYMPSSIYMYIDRAANLLSYLYCGDGPTVLLSAHMDTVEEFDRTIVKNGTTYQV
ncbi:MAG: hypothetical protein ACQEWV_13325 [Bacillota bacterium]